LADVRHFCIERYLDFTSLLERAAEHYEIESGKRAEVGLEVSPGDSADILEKQPGSAAPDSGHTLA
jgi:hypothetical protein